MRTELLFKDTKYCQLSLYVKMSHISLLFLTCGGPLLVRIFHQT